MNGNASSNPFVPAGSSRYSHHANAKPRKSTQQSTEDRRVPDRSTKHGTPSSSNFDRSHFEFREKAQIFNGEIAQMADKIERVQKDLDEATTNLRSLQQLSTRLDSFGGKNSENFTLNCSLLRTQLDGLEQTIKTMPHYYPSYAMYGDLIACLTRILTSHDYVNQISTEKTDVLRENERLREQIQLQQEDLERLKRRHSKDKRTINELERSLPRTIHESSPLKIFSPQSFTNSVNTRQEEDAKLIEMLRDLKTALLDGQENASNKEYEDILSRIKKTTKPNHSEIKTPEQSTRNPMESYFKLLETNISLLDKELKSP